MSCQFFQNKNDFAHSYDSGPFLLLCSGKGVAFVDIQVPPKKPDQFLACLPVFPQKAFSNCVLTELFKFPFSESSITRA
ncbi:hypothetical protein MHK_010336 [Candidatus Magnetomorum sp. HK-1]|nr:hypothetical protein MHK_010336 [Candidatus Magnetomorum sp. HK-1]